MENEVKTLLIEKGIPVSGGHTKRGRRRIEGGPLVECTLHRVWRVS